MVVCRCICKTDSKVGSLRYDVAVENGLKGWTRFLKPERSWVLIHSVKEHIHPYTHNIHIWVNQDKETSWAYVKDYPRRRSSGLVERAQRVLSFVPPFREVKFPTSDFSPREEILFSLGVGQVPRFTTEKGEMWIKSITVVRVTSMMVVRLFPLHDAFPL